MILHITNDYAGSKVYKNLFKCLDIYGVKQIVYTAVRSEKLVNKNKIDFCQTNSKIIYRNILTKTDRLLFSKKVMKIIEDIERTVDLNKISLIHAHTWFSDGAVAQFISNKYNIPFVVAVRNTDLNIFYKYLFHTRSVGEKVMLNTRSIFFISPIYMSRFKHLNLFKENQNTIEYKCKVILNGVDQFWLDNSQENKTNELSSPVKVLYVGKFDKGKNVLRLIQAINSLETKMPISLTLVGGGGSQNKKVLSVIANNKNIKFEGLVYDKTELLNLYRSHHIFAMPSLAETFGLVYIEALTQGLPIIYTKNEGIDTTYQNVGEAVDARNISSIENGLVNIIENYEKYRIDTLELKSNHDWMSIAQEYIEEYKKVIKGVNE